MTPETEKARDEALAQCDALLPDAPSLVERGDFDALLDAFCETFGTELCRLGGRQAQLAIAMQEFVADAENQRDAAIIVDQSRLSPSLPLRDSQPSTEGAEEYCGDCDGCGWNEGGAAIKTTCDTCGGTGMVPTSAVSDSTLLDVYRRATVNKNGLDAARNNVLRRFAELRAEIARLRGLQSTSPNASAPEEER